MSDTVVDNNLPPKSRVSWTTFEASLLICFALLCFAVLRFSLLCFASLCVALPDLVWSGLPGFGLP
jgi:hypothetical protein